MATYLISVDIEGITGVTGDCFASQKGSMYQKARKYMHNDVNATIGGIHKADPTARIVVRDAHGMSNNLDLEDLDPRAELLQGWGTALNMVEGLPGGIDAVLLVGYHAGGHNVGGILAHTFCAQFALVRLNGQAINEAGIAGLHAGHFGVPVIFLSGDDQAVEETEKIFNEIATVTVKRSLARDCGISCSLAVAAEKIIAAAELATLKLLGGGFSPWKPAKPLVMDITFANTGYTTSIYAHLRDLLSYDLSFRSDDSTLRLSFEATDQLELIHRFNLVLALIYGVRPEN